MPPGVRGCGCPGVGDGVGDVVDIRVSDGVGVGVHAFGVSR